MCTVAILPAGAGGYLLGHNRDESRLRAPGRPPRVVRDAGRAAIAPTDPEGGGTWISVNDAGLTLSLLNGAAANPSRLPARPRSRGLLVHELRFADSIAAVRKRLEGTRTLLADMKGFELVAVEPATGGSGARVARFLWDGGSAAWDERPLPCLFVSSSVDPSGAGRDRRASWSRWLAGAGTAIDDRSLRSWLASHDPERGPTSVCLHRPDAVTVSRTIVTVGNGSVSLDYLEGSPCETAGRDGTLIRWPGPA